MYGEEKVMVSVVIPAAGKGTRMGLELNKQYVDILGKPVLARTIQVFEKCSLIDEVIIASGKNDIANCTGNIIVKYGFRKVRAVVAGGASRQQSVYNGLRRISAGCGIVLIHDGARPFIDEGCIAACIKAAWENGAACAAVPLKDTIKRSDADGFVEGTIDRSSLWSVQTPQAFSYGLIMEAHRRAEAEGFVGTDDAVLAERLGHKVKLVLSSYYNIKITTKEDLAIAETIAKLLT